MILSNQRMRNRFLQIASLFMLPLLFSSLFLSVHRVDAAPTAASPTINFHAIADTTTYQNLRWQVISAEEGARLTPYLDGKCIPTIGIGFNLTNGQILSTVLNTLAPALQPAQFNKLHNKLQQIVNQNYVLANNKGTYTCQNTFPANLQNAMATFHQKNSAIPATLAFANVDPQMRATFEIAVKTYERQVDNWLKGIPNSLERIALVSLAYNSGNGLINQGKSPSLRTDLINGNRALAWYEIRYGSEVENNSASDKADKNNAAGLAKRRDFESDVFGLYDGTPFTNPSVSSVSNTNATQVMSMVVNYETQLYTSVVPDGSDLYNNQYYVNPDSHNPNECKTAADVADNEVGCANGAYNKAITAITAIEGNFVVRDLADDLVPAVNYLLSNSAATSAGNTVVLKSSNVVDLSKLGTSPSAVFVQSAGAGTTLTMSAGSGLVYSSANDTTVMGAGLEELTFKNGQHTVDVTSLYKTSTAQNLPLDTITFDGQSIAGAVKSGSMDAYGRQYNLSATVLTITDGADSLTIKGFQSGDFGVNIASQYNFTTLTVPGAALVTQINGINNTGVVVGECEIDAPGQHILAFSGTLASLSTFRYMTSSYFEYAMGINNKGQIVGLSIAASSPYNSVAWLDTNGQFTQISVPGFNSVEPHGINDNGQIILSAFNISATSESAPQDFLDSSGQITPIQVPGASVTRAYAINDAGQIVGGYNIGTSAPHGFIETNGKFTTIDIPGQAGGTLITGINNKGQIVGDYSDNTATVPDHGFIGTLDASDGLSNYTLINVPGTTTTGINDSGQIAGYYYDSQSNTVSFVATPMVMSANSG